MREVLHESDLFISIYSQTLFEASCLGIPVIYHKNDREIMDPPFDGESELVTTHNVSDLEQALQDFLVGSHRFDAFLDKSVMEKYIGPLDGKNLERNFDYVIGLLEHSSACSGEQGSDKRI
jgi:spore coat polysaccharide biosynthesis predicted glycosyltransferase SpsG